MTKMISILGFGSISGCLSTSNENSPIELLYIMTTNNSEKKQKIDLQLLTGGERLFTKTIEMPPVGTDNSEVPGTTTASQYMFVPDLENPITEPVLRVRYSNTDSWVETELTDADHRHVAGIVKLWPQSPELGYVEYPKDPDGETGEVEGAGLTASEAKEFVDSYLEDQGDRDYEV
ncbi:hypothetical protein [Halorubrum tebenquichense]|uniref:hypothetical protein n=1 Tax=Halorubrum tebenquichense TaxID=119434 RepID=UPI001F4C5CDB|nr:hypothetical protein [Halorubrum tebenquichense]